MSSSKTLFRWSRQESLTTTGWLTDIPGYEKTKLLRKQNEHQTSVCCCAISRYVSTDWLADLLLLLPNACFQGAWRSNGAVQVADTHRHSQQSVFCCRLAGRLAVRMAGRQVWRSARSYC